MIQGYLHFNAPERAADLWRERLKKNPYGSDGFLSLTYYGHDLISADLCDEVSGIWHALLELVEESIQEGSAERLFPDQPVRAAKTLPNRVMGSRVQGSAPLGPEMAEVLGEIHFPEWPQC